MNDQLINVEGVSLTLTEHTLLDGISFDIRADETLVILGVSGSGKSLLLDVLNENIPYEGQIDRSPSLTRATVGMSYDRYATFPDLKISEVLNFLSDIYESELNEFLLEKLRIKEIESRRFKVLSAGERKRLGIYACLFFEPDLAIMDEPTDSLDPILREAFWEVVNQRKGTTLLTTHLWNEAEKFHDRILLLAEGTVLDRPKTLHELIQSVPYTGKVRVETPKEVPFRNGMPMLTINERSFVYYTCERERDLVMHRKDICSTQRDAYKDYPIELEDIYYLKQRQL